MRTTCLSVATLQPERKSFSLRRVAKPALAGLLAVAWLFLVTLSVSPSLHEHFHHDAANGHHNCAVTLLQQSKLLAAGAAPLTVVLAAPFLFSIPLIPSAEFTSADLRLAPGRAPPAACSNLV